MKRRDFITGAAAAGAGLAGCAGKPRTVRIGPEGVPFSFGDNYQKPEGGSIPMTELGKTGIQVSTFTFGSHMRPYLRPYERDRERMVREAHELGVNTFDVYDREHEVYQYEPMGRFLKPVINDVNISISLLPYEGRSLEQEMERDLRCFGRDYLDMVRIHVYSPDHQNWGYYDQLFKWKEQGKIRAVGVPIHYYKNLFPLIDSYPIDYVVFPYNFFMNICWDGHMMEEPDKYATIPQLLRERGIGRVTMKPFAGDFLVTPLIEVAEMYKKKDEEEVSFAQAMLKYVINSGIADTTFTGMYYPSHVYENVDAYYHPEMTDAEHRLLNTVRRAAKTKAQACLPDFYRFFAEWTPREMRDHGSLRFA